MVEIFRALRSFLLEDPPGDLSVERQAARAAIVAAVGSRIYPQKLPQGARYPAITILRVSGQRANVLNGPASLARPRYQIDCWVKEGTGITAFADAQSLGSAVLARLDGYSGVMTDRSTSPTSNYQTGVTFDDDRDLFDPDVPDGTFRHSADFFIWHGVHPVSV